MKTLLLAPELFAADGGIARALRLYLKALCELAEPGGTVRLVALNDSAISRDQLSCHSGPRLADVEACARSKARFVRSTLLRARKTDLIVCGHVGLLPVAWACRILSPRLRYTLVAHGIEVWRAFSPLERLALRRAHQVWCVSEFTRQRLLQHVRLEPGRTVVLPNGLDPAFAPAESCSDSGPAVLTVSRLCQGDRYKGVDLLIQALPKIRALVPGTMLRVVGDGDDRARLEKLAREAGVSEVIRFLGRLDDETLNREFANCRVFALPSTGEGFGLVFLEAMAHGKPSVGADAGGIPEVISPETGLLCPPENVPGLVAACVAALERTWDVEAIRARARAFSYAPFRDRLKALLPG
ncbi:hypothetical protein DB347_18405 [Opitutaceae bacterium EW11]|nr:hypothetical protein DB347_18405 [Opitutaceae bacterium EW11]